MIRFLQQLNILSKAILPFVNEPDISCGEWKRSYENGVYGFKIEPISTKLIGIHSLLKLVMRICAVSDVKMSIDHSPNDTWWKKKFRKAPHRKWYISLFKLTNRRFCIGFVLLPNRLQFLNGSKKEPNASEPIIIVSWLEFVFNACTCTRYRIKR